MSHKNTQDTDDAGGAKERGKNSKGPFFMATRSFMKQEKTVVFNTEEERYVAERGPHNEKCRARGNQQVTQTGDNNNVPRCRHTRPFI